MKNIIKKIFVSFSFILFALSFLFSEGNFPYDFEEGSYAYTYNYKRSYDSRSIKDNSEYNCTVYRNNDNVIYVFQYKLTNPSVSQIKKILENCTPTVKKANQKFDGTYGDVDICFVFLDKNGTPICSAKYTTY